MKVLLPMTFEWIEKQIDERKYLITAFDKQNADDDMLRAIYNGQINALEAVRVVLSTELSLYK